mmetsp:Transcript_99106/g.317938  ORF Transcript_99106/g.317938 Transcript_99106/m.317938 type:complete len:231 (-) Transcript_99106:593-1285(-)
MMLLLRGRLHGRPLRSAPPDGGRGGGRPPQRARRSHGRRHRPAVRAHGARAAQRRRQRGPRGRRRPSRLLGHRGRHGRCHGAAARRGRGEALGDQLRQTMPKLPRALRRKVQTVGLPELRASGSDEVRRVDDGDRPRRPQERRAEGVQEAPPLHLAAGPAARRRRRCQGHRGHTAVVADAVEHLEVLQDVRILVAQAHVVGASHDQHQVKGTVLVDCARKPLAAISDDVD